MIQLIALGLLLLVNMVATAEEACTWMNKETASGILGNEASGSTTRSTCEFTHGADHLRIEVFVPSAQFRSYLSRCKSAPEALRAIGNEAVLCDGGASEQIAIGRVRDQVFVLSVKAPFPKPQLRDKLKLAAELVSGNLF